MTTLYAATTNPGKLREFAEAARLGRFDVLPLPNLASLPEPVEDALTFAGNAELKAVAYSAALPGHLVFADDSGLEVEALGSRPGVFSARFADQLNFEPGLRGEISKDERNNRCLLSLMHELERIEPAVTRSARFVCALALARDGKVLLRTEGVVEGDLLDAPRGTHGFGYDPLFLVRSRGLTLAELPTSEKWSLSHRGNAFRDLLHQLNSTPL